MEVQQTCSVEKEWSVSVSLLSMFHLSARRNAPSKKTNHQAFHSSSISPLNSNPQKEMARRPTASARRAERSSSGVSARDEDGLQLLFDPCGAHHLAANLQGRGDLSGVAYSSPEGGGRLQPEVRSSHIWPTCNSVRFVGEISSLDPWFPKSQTFCRRYLTCQTNTVNCFQQRKDRLVLA